MSDYGDWASNEIGNLNERLDMLVTVEVERDKAQAELAQLRAEVARLTAERDAAIAETETFRETLVDNEAYGLEVIRQRDEARADAARLTAELAEEREWIDPAVSLPADGERVLVRLLGVLVSIAVHWSAFPKWREDDGRVYRDRSYSTVTGWKPLPDVGGEE